MRRLVAAAVTVGVAVSLGGCGFGSAYDMPLPGGADLGSDPLTISADFDDVLDLVPQSSVKVDNVAVGRVSKVTLNDDGRSAHVVLKVNGDVRLPTGTTARLQQTSLLGEKYVALVRPDQPAAGTLRDGTRLGPADTSEAAGVEQVLGALSLVINGGGVEQWQEISRELQKVSEGRPGQIKAFLTEMSTFVSGLDDRKEAITASIDALGELSATLDGDKDKITAALEGLSPGMAEMESQRPQFVAMLKALDRLSGVTVRTLDRSQKDIVRDFQALAPILEQLAKAGADLPNALQILLTYPFPDSVLAAIKGDYLNLFVTTNFRTLPAGCASSGCAWPQVAGRVLAGGAARVGAAATGSTPGMLPTTSSALPGLPSPTVTMSQSQSPAPPPTDSPTIGQTAGMPADTSSPSGSPSVSGPADAPPEDAPAGSPAPAERKAR